MIELCEHDHRIHCAHVSCNEKGDYNLVVIVRPGEFVVADVCAQCNRNVRGDNVTIQLS